MSVGLKYFKGLISSYINVCGERRVHPGAGARGGQRQWISPDLSLQVVVRLQVAMKGTQQTKLLASSRAVYIEPLSHPSSPFNVF